MRMSHFAKEEYKDQIYIPDCQPDGAFDLMQCDDRREICWCVNENGQEIDGTRKPYDKNMSCRSISTFGGKALDITFLILCVTFQTEKCARQQ